MKRSRLIFLLLVLALTSCSNTDPCSDPQNVSCTRVLFIGNSYTFVNDLPKMFAELAVAGGHKEVVGSSAQGGWTLAEHLQSDDTMKLLKSTKWNFVVLQEQSQVPSISRARTLKMYPAARVLVKQIRDREAVPIFFLTWAHRDGWPENGMHGYRSMQAQVDTGYDAIARELHVPIAPVGIAWMAALQQYPDLILWQEDGTHASEEGTYLAACVFYAVIFQESPVGLSYRVDLSPDVAAKLQSVASETVLNNP